MIKYTILLLFFLFLTGCGAGISSPTPDKLATVVAETLTAVSSNSVNPPISDVATFTPIPSPTLIASTPEAAGTRYVYTSAQNVNLRVNPGRLFQVSRVLAQGTRLELLGVAPGDKWIQVRNDEGVVGWVDGLFVTGGFDGPPSPTVTPTDVVTITGFVTNDNGPITHLGLAIVQGNQFDEGFTDETGEYFIYVPKTLKGEWTLQHYATNCKSNIMDANCQCLGGTCGSLNPTFYRLTFPLANTFYRFGWQ